MTCDLCKKIKHKDYARVEYKEWVGGVLETNIDALLCPTCARLPKKYLDRYVGKSK